MKFFARTFVLTIICAKFISCSPSGFHHFFPDFIKETFPHWFENDSRKNMKETKEEFDFVKRVQQYGYTAEEYTIVNEDGYNLILHRISGGPTQPERPGKKVIYLQHGLAMYTVNFILRGPGRDLVFLLVDEGYDVWLGNARGNALSRSNVNILPTNHSFWEFSYHEVGLVDVRAFIDEVLQRTRQDKLIYIGYSLGTTESFVLLSSKPEYNKKISLGIQLAPIAFWKNNDKTFITFITTLSSAVQSANYWFGIKEVLPLKTTESSVCDFVCQQFNHLLKPQFEHIRYDQATETNFDKTFPAGTSAKTIFHLNQNIKSGFFRAYDYDGANLKIYGNDYPPEYSLHKITAPIALFYSNKDVFTTDLDIALLKSKLPNVVESKKIPYHDFTHFDFIWANDAKTQLYDDILSLIKKYV